MKTSEHFDQNFGSAAVIHNFNFRGQGGLEVEHPSPTRKCQDWIQLRSPFSEKPDDIILPAHLLASGLDA